MPDTTQSQICGVQRTNIGNKDECTLFNGREMPEICRERFSLPFVTPKEAGTY